KTNGSPPFRRTTFLPCFAYWIRSLSMNACGVDLQPPRLPTSRTRAPVRTCARQPRFTSLSISTTSAAPSARAALSVSSSGSPGPAPIRVTRGRMSGRLLELLAVEEVHHRGAQLDVAGLAGKREAL